MGKSACAFALKPEDLPQPQLSEHAVLRCLARGIPVVAVQAALEYGRVIHGQHAKMYVIGRKEADRFEAEGVDLRDYEGVHVVCDPQTEIVLTTFRNHSLAPARLIRRAKKWWKPRASYPPAA